MEACAFTKFFLDEHLLKGIAESGYGELTPLQDKMVLPLLERKNLIIQASSGAGKTAGYLIPLLHTMSGRVGPRVMVITPTRDLAVQVYNEVRRLSRYMEGVRSVLLDPGSSIKQQARRLEDYPEIVIGTPGRILDHMRRENLKAEELDALVVDEVDRVLDHGQRPDVESLLKKSEGYDQGVALSSTISPPVLRLCRKVAPEGEELFNAPEKPVVEAVRHSWFRVNPEAKLEMLRRLAEREAPERAIVFCRTKVVAARVADRLGDLQGGAVELHMGFTSRKQEQIIKRFREGDFNLLVTTDTFTRALDVENVSHVINFDIPEDPEDYLVRIGNTARLGSKGRAMTLVTPDEMDRLHALEEHLNRKIEEEVLPGLEPSEEAHGAAVVSAAGGSASDRSRSPYADSTEEPKPMPKTEYIHGGWYRKRKRRGRR